MSYNLVDVSTISFGGVIGAIVLVILILLVGVGAASKPAEVKHEGGELNQAGQYVEKMASGELDGWLRRHNGDRKIVCISSRDHEGATIVVSESLVSKGFSERE